jgi:hypothetical protein
VKLSSSKGPMSFTTRKKDGEEENGGISSVS